MNWQTLNYIFQGALVTLELWLLTVVISMPLSIVVALIRNYKVKVLSEILTIYTNIVRGTPLMLQLYVVYFMLPMFSGIKLDGFASALVTFVLSWVAYINEVLRVSLSSIEKWQYDSAKALGFSFVQTLIYIILPQVFWRASGAIWNEIINIMYNTPVIALIGLDELLKNVKVLVVRSFDFTYFIWVALFYLIFNNILILISKKIEKRLTKFKIAEIKND